MKHSYNYRIHLTRWAVTALAEKHRRQDHHSGLPGPRRPQLAGDANVRGSSTNAAEFVTVSDRPNRGELERRILGSLRCDRRSEGHGCVIASHYRTNGVHPAPAAAVRDSLRRAAHTSRLFHSIRGGLVEAVFQTGGRP
jgi:hypothetical protein